MQRSAAILYGHSLHHLDHLAPLSSLLNIPLIVDDESLYSLAKKFYPKIHVIGCDPQEVYFYASQNFDQLITCMPRPLFDSDFFLPQLLLEKKLHTIWCPHGNSDKGRSSFFMEGLSQEELLLVYGKRMEEFLKEKGVVNKQLIVGNYRFRYFLENKAFYEKLLRKEIFSSLSPKKTILYAPTWSDSEKNSSFEQLLDPLIDSFNEEVNLIIKPHPHLFSSHPLEMEKIDQRVRKTKSLVLLKDLPVIYPLLHFVDAYLGDASSIGYDFLTFQKPMFFFAAEERRDENSLQLHRCGHVFSKENAVDFLKKIKAFLDKKEDSFCAIQKKIYNETFSERSQIEHLKLVVNDEQYPL